MAQLQTNSGAVQGTVTDSTGAAIAGATVTATSPALQGQLVYTTNEQGDYRFPNMPLGVYRITYAAPGFGTIQREGVEVRLNFTATIDIKLSPATQEQKIIVMGDTPLVDVQSSTVEAGFTKEQLTDVPNGRDMWNIIAVTPGMTTSTLDVGGSAVGNQTSYTSFGYGGQNRVMIDGINTSEGTSGAGFYFDYGSFAEFTVGTAGNDASMPVPGNQINAVIRTGGNTIHGEFYQDYENPSFQGHNISQAQVFEGAGVGTRITTYHDSNGNIGGPIKKDRVWYFVSLRNQVSAYGVVGFPVQNPGSVAFYSKDQNITYKLSGQINKNHRLSNYIQWNPILKPFRGAASNYYQDAVYYQKAVAWVGNVQYNAIITPKFFVDVLLGTWGYNFPQVPYGPNGSLGYGAILQTDVTSGNIAGSHAESRSDPRRYQFEPSGSYYLDNFLGVNHQIRFGWVTERETEDDEQYGPLGQVAYSYKSPVGQDFTVPYQVTLYNDPVVSWNLTMHHGAYVQDQMKVGKRLTLNVGARWDYYRSFYLPEQTRPDCRFCQNFYNGVPFPNGYTIPANPALASGSIPGNSNVLRYPFLIAPRLGAAWDLTGKGRTVLKLNWGYYYSYNSTNIVDAVQPLQQTSYTFTWNDPTNAPFNLNQLGSFVSNTGGTNYSVQPHIKAPRFDDMGIVLQHQISDSVSVEGGFVFRELHHDWQAVDIGRVNGLFTLPVTKVIPGPNDGCVGAPGSFNCASGDQTGAQTVTVYDIPKSAVVPSVLQYQTPPGNNSIYRNFEFTINKHLSSHFTAVGSFYWTSSSLHNGGVATNPNAAVNNTYTISTWASHVTGLYQAPFGIHISPVLRMQSGAPIGRTYSVTGLDVGTVTYQIAPIGAYRANDIYDFDVRFEKEFVIKERFHLSADFDLFNVFNSNAAEVVNSTTTQRSVAVNGTSYQFPGFLSPSTILPPRIFRIGGRFRF